MLLEGKKVVIMGVRNKWSIAWGAAQSAYEQGAEVICTCSGDSVEKVKDLVKDMERVSVYECNDVSKDEDIDKCLEEIKKDHETRKKENKFKFDGSNDLKDGDYYGKNLDFIYKEFI